MSQTTTGNLLVKQDTEQITDTFKKRMFVLEITDGQYTQTVPFELLQDAVSKIDAFNAGDQIKVHFNLRGREYNGRYFVNLQAWRLEAVQTSETQAEKPKEPAKVETDDSGKDNQSDLPF